MLKGGNPLTVGVEIVIEVIRKNNSDYDPDILLGTPETPAPLPSGRDPIYLGTLLRLFASHVPDFMKLILERDVITVANEDGTKSEVKRQLKTASGRTIEPLGFDRFKTCELMAELLHCSNMGLLNERGGERYVKARDTERERLRRENVQQPDRKLQTDEGSNTDDGRGRLEVQNGGDMDCDSQGSHDDDFEELAMSSILSEEAAIAKLLERTTIDETLEAGRIAAKNKVNTASEHNQSGSEKSNQQGNPSVVDEDPKIVVTETEHVLSPAEEDIVMKDDDIVMKDDDDKFEEISIAVEKSFADVPILDTTTKIEPLSIDKDKRSTQSHVQPLPPVAASVNRLNAELPPLPSDLDNKHLPPVPDAPTGEFSGSSGAVSEAPFGSASEDTFKSLLLGSGFTEYGAMVEEDVDGGPVVGDYLKMMFVEHSVVPTILVCHNHNLPTRLLISLEFFLPFPLE